MRRLLWIGFVIGTLAMATRCGEDNPRTLSSLGLTGTFYPTDTTSECRAVRTRGANDNLSQKIKVEVTNSLVTVTNTIYDNGTQAIGTGVTTGCQTGDEVYQIIQKFNVSSVASASAVGAAKAIDNNSKFAGEESWHDDITSGFDNFTTHRLTGTVGEVTIQCYEGGQLLSGTRGCTILKQEKICGLQEVWEAQKTDNSSAHKVNGAGQCFNGITTSPSHNDNVTKMMGIMLDNNTFQVPHSGTTAYLTLGYFTQSSKKKIAFRELLGPNYKGGYNSNSEAGKQSHTSFYFNDGNVVAGIQDNITAYWGKFDNLSNMFETQ